MGISDFTAGYTLGAKAGNQGFEELLTAGRQVLKSREFQALLSAARSHAGSTLRQLGELVEGGEAAPPAMDNVLDMVKALVERRKDLFGFAADEPPAGADTSRPRPRPF